MLCSLNLSIRAHFSMKLCILNKLTKSLNKFTNYSDSGNPSDPKADYVNI